MSNEFTAGVIFLLALLVVIAIAITIASVLTPPLQALVAAGLGPQVSVLLYLAMAIVFVLFLIWLLHGR